MKQKQKKSIAEIIIFALFFILIIIIAIRYHYARKGFEKDFYKIESFDSNSINVAENIEKEDVIVSSTPETTSKPPKLPVLLPPGLELPLCAENVPDHEIRHFHNYTICYRESYEQAEWSAYRLCDFQLQKNASRTNDFRPDPGISTASATPLDYKGSGYDRGHLTPAADMAFSEQAMSETFFMSNMSPQTPQFNRGVWKHLEAQVRDWAAVFGRVYVVSGPVLSKAAAEYNSIGENKVSIPEFYYKVILVPLYENDSDKDSPNDATFVAAIGFIIPNQKCDDSFWNYAASVDQVERATGLDFYPLLDDKTENEVEARLDIDVWR